MSLIDMLLGGEIPLALPPAPPPPPVGILGSFGWRPKNDEESPSLLALFPNGELPHPLPMSNRRDSPPLGLFGSYAPQIEREPRAATTSPPAPAGPFTTNPLAPFSYPPGLGVPGLLSGDVVPQRGAVPDRGDAGAFVTPLSASRPSSAKPAAPWPAPDQPKNVYEAEPPKPHTFSPVANPEMRNDGLGGGAHTSPRRNHKNELKEHGAVDIVATPGDRVFAPISGTFWEGYAYTDTHPLHKDFRAITVKGDDGTRFVIRYTQLTEDLKKALAEYDIELKKYAKRRAANQLRPGEQPPRRPRIEAGQSIGIVQDRAARNNGMVNHVHVEKYWNNERLDATGDLRWWMGHRGIY